MSHYTRKAVKPGESKSFFMKTQIDGKDWEGARKKPQSLDEIFGYNKNTKFPTTSEAEYIAKLKKMNKADLQNECLRIHEVPHDERPRMEDKLLKQFRRWASSMKTPTKEQVIIPDNDKTQKAHRALANLLGAPMSAY